MKSQKFQGNDWKLGELSVGMFVHYDIVLGRQAVEDFADLTGDVSPLHVDPAYAQTTPYGGNLVHGMLAASCFSTMVGVLLPGRPALLSNIQIDFLQPIPVGSSVTVCAKVLNISQAASTITLGLAILLEDKICVSGKAGVMVRS